MHRARREDRDGTQAEGRAVGGQEREKGSADERSRLETPLRRPQKILGKQLRSRSIPFVQTGEKGGVLRGCR